MENNKPAKTVRRISSLAEHRSLLREVFMTAKSRIVVVSPFISSKAISSDRIPSQISSAVGRGVSVQVFTDSKLNRASDGSFKPSASEGMADMINSGAKVSIVDGIHNKTLARDNDLIAEGSFNWLSAVRIPGGENQREERTMIVEGEEARGMIEKEVAGLEGKGRGCQPEPSTNSNTSIAYNMLGIIVLTSIMVCGNMFITSGGVPTLVIGLIVQVLFCSFFYKGLKNGDINKAGNDNEYVESLYSKSLNASLRGGIGALDNSMDNLNRD